MEPKKNPKADVKRNSALYFAVGLALMLLVTNLAINYKTYDLADIALDTLNVDLEDDEEIPITDQPLTPPPPPPPPPATPEEIEIVDDEEEVEETVIESTETDESEEIVEVDDIEVEDEVVDVEVPFSVIENVPVFPGCEKKKNNNDRKACMSEKINKFVGKKFNTDLASDLGLSGKMRINVIFKIDKTGNVVGVRARAPHPSLAKEAERVINLLPKMKPGRQRGNPVTVPYSLPIRFEVQ